VNDQKMFCFLFDYFHVISAGFLLGMDVTLYLEYPNSIGQAALRPSGIDKKSCNGL